jgi:Ca-activated chloride channel family protein
MATGNFYDLLGIAAEATAEEIKTAYRNAARRFHPDLNPDPSALEELKLIADAYAILSDSAQRQAYNAALAKIGGGPLLTPQVITSRTALHYLDEPQVLYALVTLRPSITAQKLPAPPVNLCLVIDRSTSMQGERLDRVKTAAQAIIDTLRENDAFCAVSFSDRAEVVIPLLRGPAERTVAKARLSTLDAAGGTEMLEGLLGGLCTLQPQLSPTAVNHLLLLTDGHTYGDEDRCLLLAKLAANDGITLSAFGIGDEWNDKFLDELTGMTGGTATYINSSEQVKAFVQERVKGLGTAYAERVNLRILPDRDVKVLSAFRIGTEPGPVAVETGPLPLGSVPRETGLTVLLKFLVPPLPANSPTPRPIARLSAVADIVSLGRRDERTTVDIILPVQAAAATAKPPSALLTALSHLSQYRLQERASQAVSDGNIAEATQCLSTLGTRLLASGQTQLAKVALAEARRLEKTQVLSEGGKKNLKYGTRALLMTAPMPNT